MPLVLELEKDTGDSEAIGILCFFSNITQKAFNMRGHSLRCAFHGTLNSAKIHSKILRSVQS